MKHGGQDHAKNQKGTPQAGSLQPEAIVPVSRISEWGLLVFKKRENQIWSVHVVLCPDRCYATIKSKQTEPEETMPFLLTALFLLFSSVSPAFSQPSICIIHSYHKEYAWEKGLTSGLVDALPTDATLSHFYLDTKRTLKETHRQRADAIWEQVRDTSWDLVILCDDNASRYVGPRFKDGPIPVVYVGMNRNPRDYGLFPAPNMTGVLERPLLKRSLHSMCRLVNPADTKVLVLFDSDATSDAIVHEAFQDKSYAVLGKVRVELKQFGRLEEWQDALLNAEADGFDTVYIGLYHTLRDKTGAHVPEDEVLAWANANTPVPIFAFWDFAVGKGKTIGGHVLSSRDQGLAAGRIACRILNGTPPASIAPHTAHAGAYVFSTHELDRFGIRLTKGIRAQATIVP
jgi:ABC-type uncharacterized transport system substrate-binding protein